MPKILEKSINPTKDNGEDTVKYLFTESDTFAKLKREIGCHVVNQAEELCGYEVYIVEQWACQRKLNYSIATYTGNPDHKIIVNVLGIPRDSKVWSPVLKTYFDELIRLHLRPKETGLGLLYVTNLSSFPSNLNLVPIPEGSIPKALRLFRVSENLRRTGCGGRLVLQVSEPSDACADKFEQVFKTEESVPITFAVVELVTMVQISLFYCGLLEPQYVDGLLCDMTVQAIRGWWNKWGQLRFHSKPTDGTLGPTTVAAILGFVTGFRNRLASLNYKAPKDPFDAEEFVFSLKQFQKHEHLPKTLKIDEETFYRLYGMTDKSSNSDFLGIVKSTMKEVSGKQVLSKADSETLDLERFKNNAVGRRARYLFLGKGTMRTICVATTECQSTTGIPLSSLSLDEEVSSNLDLRRAMMKSVANTRIKTDVRFKTGVMKIKNLQGKRTPRRPEAPLDPDEFVKHLENRLTIQPDTSESWTDKSRAQLRKYLSPYKKDSRSPYSSSDEGPRLDTPDKEADKEEEEAAQLLDPSCQALSGYRAGDELQSVLGCKCQSKDDTVLYLHYRRRPHRRSYSFSAVDHYVLDRTRLLSVPVVTKSYALVAEYYSRIGDLATSLEAVKETVDARLGVAGRNLNRNTVVMEKTSNQLDSMNEKETELREKLQEVEAIAARLQYESRMVDMKVKDVEDSVSSFGSKLAEIETRADYLKCPSKKLVKARYWDSRPMNQLSSSFSFLHRYLTTQNQSSD